MTVQFYNPRDFTVAKGKRVDAIPYGGGPGMVMRAEPVLKAWAAAKGRKRKVKTIIFSPGGQQLTNGLARQYTQDYNDIIMLCGRYEGIDQRVADITEAEPVSIGDYVITGGELAAMITIDVAARQVPGILGSYESLEEERVSSHAVYTRPESFKWKGKKYDVPEVLLSGHHAKIDAWREGN